jgi:hypothetical protein
VHRHAGLRCDRVDDHTITDCGGVDKRSENELAINADA